MTMREIKRRGAEFDLLLLLKELNNPDDPAFECEAGVGIRSERFAPLLEQTEEEEEAERIGVGHGEKTGSRSRLGRSRENDEWWADVEGS